MTSRYFLFLITVMQPICIWGDAFAENATPPEQREFKVGELLALTGTAADYGQAMNNALGMAVTDHPEKFKDVKFLVEDSRNDAKTAITAFRKLVQADKVDLIYLWGVAPCGAVVPVAETMGVPTIIQCYNRDSARNKKHIIRFMNDTSDYMGLLNQQLVREGRKNFGMLVSEAPFLEEMFDEFRKEKRADQKLDLIGRFHPTDNDLRIPISRMRGASYDSVGVFLSVGQIAQFFRQAREQRLTLPMFGTLSFENHGEIVAAAGAMEGSVFVGNAVLPDFVARYRERFGSENQISFAAMQYEFAILAGDLFGGHPLKPSEDVLERFTKLPPRKGSAVSKYEYVDSPELGRYFKFPLTAKRVKGESVEEIH